MAINNNKPKTINGHPYHSYKTAAMAPKSVETKASSIQ
jgi:hypothetical protein